MRRIISLLCLCIIAFQEAKSNYTNQTVAINQTFAEQTAAPEPKQSAASRKNKRYDRLLTYAYIESPLCALNLGFLLEFGNLQNLPNTLVGASAVFF